MRHLENVMSIALMIAPIALVSATFEISNEVEESRMLDGACKNSVRTSSLSRVLRLISICLFISERSFHLSHESG